MAKLRAQTEKTGLEFITIQLTGVVLMLRQKQKIEVAFEGSQCTQIRVQLSPAHHS